MDNYTFLKSLLDMGLVRFDIYFIYQKVTLDSNDARVFIDDLVNLGFVSVSDSNKDMYRITHQGELFVKNETKHIKQNRHATIRANISLGVSLVSIIVSLFTLVRTL